MEILSMKYIEFNLSGDKLLLNHAKPANINNWLYGELMVTIYGQSKVLQDYYDCISVSWSLHFCRKVD